MEITKERITHLLALGLTEIAEDLKTLNRYRMEMDKMEKILADTVMEDAEDERFGGIEDLERIAEMAKENTELKKEIVKLETFDCEECESYAATGREQAMEDFKKQIDSLIAEKAEKGAWSHTAVYCPYSREECKEMIGRNWDQDGNNDWEMSFNAKMEGENPDDYKSKYDWYYDLMCETATNMNGSGYSWEEAIEEAISDLTVADGEGGVMWVGDASW